MNNCVKVGINVKKYPGSRKHYQKLLYLLVWKQNNNNRKKIKTHLKKVKK